MKEILYVEDSADDIRLLRAALGEEADRFVCCGDGESAWALFNPRRFPVVLVDLKLPNMTGVELIRRIRELSPDTIIHVVSSSPDPQLRAEAIACGATGVFEKPYRLVDYRLLMRQIATQAAAFERGRNANIMSSWMPKLGGVLAIIGVGLKKHPVTAPWSELVESIGVGILGFSVRQNNVTSEEAGAKPPSAK